MNLGIRKLCFSLLCISSIGPLASASDFNDVLSTLMSNNLEYRAAVAADNATVTEMKAENVLDAPEISYEKVWGAKGIGNKESFSISQSFDWPVVYAARRSAIKMSETALQYLRESTALDIRMNIRVALIDMINVRQRIATTRKICDGLASMVSYFKKAVEQGNETRLDYSKAVLEHVNSVRELKMLKSDSAVVAASLRTLNGGNDIANLIEKLGTEYPLTDLEMLCPNRETLRMKDPAVAAARESTAAQEAVVKVEKRSLFPGFSIGYIHEYEMGDNFNGFSISVSLPFLTQRAKSKAAKLRLESTRLDEEMALIKISSELQSEYETALELRELLREYSGVVSDDSCFELLRKSAEFGQINSLTYMSEISYFLAARRDFLDVNYRYNLSLARLQRYE